MNHRIPLFVLALGLLALGGRGVFAQLEGPPTEIDYQGMVYDPGGKPYGSSGSAAPYTAAPENYTMEFRIYDQLTGGNVVWAQSQLVTVSLGRFSVRLGPGGSPIGNLPHPDLSAVFDGRNRYLSVKIHAGPEPYGEISPRLAFLTAPYAFTAQKAVEAQTASTALVASSVVQGAGTSSFDQMTVKNATATTSFKAPTIEATTEVKGGLFTGNGSSLTDLNAGAITTGTLPDARLSSNVVLKQGVNQMDGRYTFTDTQNQFKGIGTALTNLDASQLTQGMVPDARLSGNIIKNFDLGTKPLYLRTEGDLNHVLRYGGGAPWNIDGAVLSGYAGGILGQSNFANNWYWPIIRWDDSGARIYRDLFLQTTSAAHSYAGRWRIYQRNMGHLVNSNGDELRFQWLGENDPVPSDTDLAHAGTYFFVQRTGDTGKSSDRRLKTDITPVGSVLESVLRLEPVNYHMKGMEDVPLSTGYIAQDVEPLFPEAVSLHDGYYGLSYDALAVYSTRALQELAAESRANAAKAETEIRRLNGENRALRQRLDALEERLNALEASAK